MGLNLAIEFLAGSRVAQASLSPTTLRLAGSVGCLSKGQHNIQLLLSDVLYAKIRMPLFGACTATIA